MGILFLLVITSFGRPVSLPVYLQVQKQTTCSATDVTGTKEGSASGQFKRYRQV